MSIHFLKNVRYRSVFLDSACVDVWHAKKLIKGVSASSNHAEILTDGIWMALAIHEPIQLDGSVEQ